MLLLNEEGIAAAGVGRLTQPQHLMLFDLSVGGHHPGYIQHLIEYWGENRLLGQLEIVVSPQFMTLHSDVVEIAKSYEHLGVQFVPVTSEEIDAMEKRSHPIFKARRAFQEWDLLCKYAKKLQVGQVFLMYFDTAQVPMIFGQKPPCLVSGIYFRPTFHYGSFEGHRYDLKDWIQVWRERFNLSQLLHNRQMHVLFCLDPFVVEHLPDFRGSVKTLHLADPVKHYGTVEPTPDQLRDELGIARDRKIFLFFGALTRRKGLYQVLEALPMLSPELGEKCCLVLVGPLGAGAADKQRLQSLIEQISQTTPVQIVVQDRFVSDREIQPYFQLTDVVLAPYQRHVGMSAILARAAAAQKPVLCSDYGLMGEVTRRYQLGITVDSTQPGEVAQGLTRFLSEPPELLGDRAGMQQFAAQNTADQFARAVFENLFAGNPHE